MLVELVRTKTADGLRLHGALSIPPGNTTANVDAVVLIHGVGSNFYSSSMMESICESLVQHGIAAVRVNTRGHDGVNTISTEVGGRLQGAAFEIVDECRHDVTSWCSFLVDRGFTRIGLLGHSLGAIKVLYAAAHAPHPNVVRVVAVSPPRLSHARLSVGTGGESFRSSWKDAQRLMSENQPKQLFKAEFPFPLVLSAGTFADKYGPQDRYNIVSLAPCVEGSMEFVFGQQELDSGNAAFDGLVPELMAADWKVTPPKIQVVSDANHFYAGRFPQLNQAVMAAIR